jgi:uncharacterized repeat protein (TIGR01451 family)
VNVDGITSTGFPPDPNLDVGPNHVIEIQNSTFQVFDKQGNTVAGGGPFNINSIWSQVGANDTCTAQNNGDPVVQYDQLADRWVIMQFALPNGLFAAPSFDCFAISQFANPLPRQNWFVYQFRPIPNDRIDYPKFSVWPDAYYLTSQEGYNGNPLDVVAFDRANMLNGNPATFQRFSVAGPPTVILLPGDLDGTPPPAGTPALFARPIDGALFGGADRVEIYEFHVDWNTPGSSTFGLSQTLNTTFDSNLCGGASLFNNCVPQPGTSQTLETLTVWPMGPLQYHNFGSYETLVFAHTVDADGADHAGMRWYELRRSSGTWSFQQQGTYSPDGGAPGLADDPHRWMGSVAMDKAGDMALGYSVSDGTSVFPGVSYTGRLASDPAGLMPAGEFSLVAGGAIQTGNRWGDYSSMVVDPVDGCSFWYVQEYIANTNNDRRTRIGSFRFPSCNPTDLSVTKSDDPDPVLAGNDLRYEVTVTNNGPNTATGVVLTDDLPDGLDLITTSVPCTLGGGNVLTCDLDTVGSGHSVTVSIKVAVPSDFDVPGGPTFVTNIASVASDWDDPDLGNNSTTEDTLIDESADLQVTKLCKPDGPIPAGQTATCTVFVDNHGPSDARDVHLTDTHIASAGFTIGTVTPSQGTCTKSGGTVSCDLGVLPAASATQTGRATITIELTATEAADINDIATVTSATPDPDTSNNQAQGTVSVTAVADLAITKADTPDPLNAGTHLTYTLRVTNQGPSTAVNTVVEDQLPAGVSVISVSATGGSCNLGVPGNPFRPTTCTFDSIAPAGVKTMTIVVNVDPGVLNVAHNDARVFSNVFDPDNSDNLASTDTSIQVADLVITKSSDLDVYKPSSTVQYRITVDNRGPADAASVVVTDNLPDVKQAIYLTDTGACTKSALVLTCPLGTVPAGTTRTFNVYVRIRGNKGLVTNSASVASATFDYAPANNTSIRVILIKGGV